MAGLDVSHLELLRPGVQKSKDDFIVEFVEIFIYYISKRN